MISWLKLCCTLLAFIPSQAYISFQFPESDDAPNVPVIDVEEYPVIPFIWDPTSKVLEFCIEKPEDANIDLSIVQDAMDNINAQLYSGDISTMALYFMLNTEKECNTEDLKIKLVKRNNSIKSPGYCTRKFLNGTIDRPMILYSGCDITLNICALQTYASLYNVLLHELLHVVGLDHPDPPVQGSVISYGVRVNDFSLMNVIQDTTYVALQPFDIMNMRFIALRDFPNSILPDPRMIASYIPKQNASGHIGGDEYRIDKVMNVETCWMSKTETVFPTVQPTVQPIVQPTVQPSMRPKPMTLHPTRKPTTQPIMKNPTKSPITQKIRRKRRRRRQRRQNNNQNKNTTSNTATATISTLANPEIYLDTHSESVLNISTEIQPDITVDLLDGDVNMKTIVSPKIDIQGQAKKYNIITEINPIISIKQRQTEVLPPPKQWDRYP